MTEPEAISFRRWETGEVIGFTRLIPNFRNTFGGSYYVIHRADFHSALYRRALDLGVTVKLGSRVVDYKLEGPSICLRDGTSLSADLVIAADGQSGDQHPFYVGTMLTGSYTIGVKSAAREIILETKQLAFEPTGFAAYRATVDAEHIKEDPEISWLLERPSLNIWSVESSMFMALD